MSGCPALSPDGVGITQALRVADCLSHQGAEAAFARIFGPSGGLAPVLTLGLTLYVALLALNLLSGRSSLRLSMLTPRMMTLGLVLTFATSWVAYQTVIWNLLSGASDQIATLLSGTRGSATAYFAGRLDILFNALADAAQAGGGETTTPDPGQILWVAALIFLLSTAAVLVAARIALAAVLALGPLFIVLALFRGTHGLFEGWLKAAIMFALIPLFTVLIGATALTMLNPLIDHVAHGGAPTLRLATMMLVAVCIHLFLMAIVLRTATVLTAGWRIGGSDRADTTDRGAAAEPSYSHLSGPMPAGERAVAAQAGDDIRVRSTIAAFHYVPETALAAVVARPVRLVEGTLPSVRLNGGDPRVRSLSGAASKIR